MSEEMDRIEALRTQLADKISQARLSAVEAALEAAKVKIIDLIQIKAGSGIAIRNMAMNDAANALDSLDPAAILRESEGEDAKDRVWRRTDMEWVGGGQQWYVGQKGPFASESDARDYLRQLEELAEGEK